MNEPPFTPDFMDPLLPPKYSPSQSSPSYTAEPHPDEERLDLAASPRPAAPQGSVTKKTRRITIALHQQEPDATIATYARNAVIKGDVAVREEDVEVVDIKLEGRQLLSIAEGGDVGRIMFAETHCLWRKRGEDHCPPSLQFYVPFPANFTDKLGLHPVPPSYEVSFPGVPGLHARISYTLTVTMTKSRLGSWKKHKSTSMPITYSPRSRPYLPIPHSLHPFLSTIKSAPEEWRQVISSVPSRDPTVAPIDVHLFIPAVQIYALSDTVPFHLQLKAPAESLRKFMGVSDLQRVPTRTSTRSSSSSSFSLPSPHTLSWAAIRSPSMLFSPLPHPVTCARLTGNNDKKPGVRVFLMRQISAKVHGQKAWRNVVIGEGKLSPLEHPPSWSPAAREDEALDWEGEVRCNEDVASASFIAGDLHIKDFVVINLCPSEPGESPLTEHQHAHPIRLVTNSYRETLSHPSDN